MIEIYDDERNIFAYGATEEDAILLARRKLANITGLPIEEIRADNRGVDLVIKFKLTSATSDWVNIYTIRQAAL